MEEKWELGMEWREITCREEELEEEEEEEEEGNLGKNVVKNVSRSYI